MRIEILTEDKSGSVAVESLVRQICYGEKVNADLYVRPHRGCGSLPMDWSQRPAKFAAALLDLLPAKCRAYNNVLKGTDTILIVVMDSDNNDPEELKSKLYKVCSKCAPDLKCVIGLCVEEIESWLLGDKKAILQAYPNADISALNEYTQDSICGTWEQLCRVVCPDNCERIIDVGYPAIGEYKARWSRVISRYMLPENNVSPSFRAFRRTLIGALQASRPEGATPVRKPKIHTRTF